MMRNLVASLALMLVVRAVPAQDARTGLHGPDNPASRSAGTAQPRNRLGADLLTDGRRDCVLSVIHTGRQLITQTRGGVLALLDAETGRPVWRVRIGTPYASAFPPAFNSQSVFASNGTILYSLDRSNGALQWKLSLPGGLAAPPIADEEQVFLFTGTGSAYAYRPSTVEVPVQVGPYATAQESGQRDLSVKVEQQITQQLRPVPQWDTSTPPPRPAGRSDQ